MELVLGLLSRSATSTFATVVLNTENHALDIQYRKQLFKHRKPPCVVLDPKNIVPKLQKD